MEEGLPQPPLRPVEETAASSLEPGAIPPFEPLVEQPVAVEPAAETPVAAAITPAEREQWCQRAGRACTEGRLTLGAYSDLVEILQDSGEREAFEAAAEEVRAAGSSVAVAPVASGSPMLAILGGHDRKGPTQLGPVTPALAMMGGIDLDLREATVSGPLTVIRGFAVMGGVDVRVPPGIRVETRCLPVLGGCDVKLRGRPPRQDAPVLRLELTLVMAGATVKDGGGMKDLLRQGATLAASGFSESRQRLHQSRVEARAAERVAHRVTREARHEARRAAHRARHDRDL